MEYPKEPEAQRHLQHALQRALTERNYLLGAESELLDRALGILHRMGTEQTGWRGFFRRWYYSHEPLRNDAANLVREARFGFACMPKHTRLVGDHGLTQCEKQSMGVGKKLKSGLCQPRPMPNRERNSPDWGL